jgi:ABC-type sugar transport system ATPase subunit
MRARGLAVVVVSHNLLHVLRVADRIAVLYHGELVRVLGKAEANPQMIVALMMGRRSVEGGGAPRATDP